MVINITGFSLFLFVELICFHGTILFPGLFGISQDLGIAIMTIGLFGKAFGFLGNSFSSTINPPKLKRQGLIGITLFVVGITLLSLIGTENKLDQLNFSLMITLILSGAFIGVGDALVTIVFGKYCTTLPLKTSYRFVVGCHVIAILFYGSTFIVSGLVQVFLVLLALLGTAVVLLKMKAPLIPAFNSEALRSSFSVLWRPLFGTSVFCFLSGLMPWVSGQYDSPIEMMRLASLVSTLALLALLAIPTFLVKKVPHLESLYIFILPLIATGFLLLPVIWNGYGGIVNVFAGVGAYAASLVLWCLAADSARKHKLNAAIVFGFCFGITTGASALGRLFGYFGGKSLSSGDMSITAISLISLYFLSMLALFIFRRQEVKVSTSSHEAFQSPVSLKENSSAFRSEKSLQGFEKRDLACEAIAQEEGLSARETEVLNYLSRGCSMPDIAKRLSISENTARTHIKRVYKKLGVHSKQDIIDRCRNS